MVLLMCLNLIPGVSFAYDDDYKIRVVDVNYALPEAGQHPQMDLD